MSDDGVRIYEPDKSLHAKIGNVSLDKVFTPEVVSRAQTVIHDSIGDLLAECHKVMRDLTKDYKRFSIKPTKDNPALPLIVEKAFSIKSKSNQGGNILASRIAESLQNHSESVLKNGPDIKTLKLVNWHVQTLDLFLRSKYEGYGGSAGEALMREITNLPANKLAK